MNKKVQVPVELKPLAFKGTDIRVLEKNTEVLFNAGDIVEALGFSRSTLHKKEIWFANLKPFANPVNTTRYWPEETVIKFLDGLVGSDRGNDAIDLHGLLEKYDGMEDEPQPTERVERPVDAIRIEGDRAFFKSEGRELSAQMQTRNNAFNGKVCYFTGEPIPLHQEYYSLRLRGNDTYANSQYYASKSAVTALDNLSYDEVEKFRHTVPVQAHTIEEEQPVPEPEATENDTQITDSDVDDIKKQVEREMMDTMMALLAEYKVEEPVKDSVKETVKTEQPSETVNQQSNSRDQKRDPLAYVSITLSVVTLLLYLTQLLSQ